MSRRHKTTPVPPLDLLAALPHPRVTRKRTAEVLCYTERTVDRLIAQGILRAYKVPGRSRVLIERASIIALMTEAVA